MYVYIYKSQCSTLLVAFANRQETGADGVVVGSHIGLKLKVMHTPQPLGDNQRKPPSNRRIFGGICPDFS